MAMRPILYTFCLCLLSLFAHSQAPVTKSLSVADLKIDPKTAQQKLEKFQIKNPFLNSTKEIATQEERLQNEKITADKNKSIENNPANLKLRTQKTQGGESGGGGTIVGFFEAPDNTYKITGVVDSEGRLRSEFRNRIQQAFATDTREQMSALYLRNSNNGTLFEPSPEDTPESYLNKIIEKGIAPRSPQFAKILRQALYQVRRELWIPVAEGLPLMRDLGATPSLSEMKETNTLGPVLLQVIRRTEITDSRSGISKVTSIEYDPDLYEKLLTLNRNLNFNSGAYQQAVLLLHEAIYAIATSHGQVNSAKVRGLTHLLFEMDMYRAVNTNFEFLYMLYAYGILDKSFFGYESENAADLASYKKIISFGEILKRMAEYRRMDLVNGGFNCDNVEQKWSDLNCTIEGFLRSLSFSSDFSKVKPEWLNWFSENELNTLGNDFSFLWAVQLGLGYPDRMTQVLNNIQVRPALFENFLIANNEVKNIELMKSTCANMDRNAQLTRRTEGFFQQNGIHDLKIQELILKKALLYCKSQSAI